MKRQVEIYDSGPALRYDDTHIESLYGGLAEKPLWNGGDEQTQYEPIEAETFEAA